MKKILIIDDDESMRILIRTLLNNTGKYNSVQAKNGKEGLQLAKKIQPDLILLDITMPKMNGIETLKRLKKLSKTSSIPVIMLTVHAEDKFKIDAASLFCDDYITKPFNKDKLVQNIEAVLARSGR